MLKMNRLRLLFPGTITFSRHYNWKYPCPPELQPQPLPEEKIDPSNVVKPDEPVSKNDCFNKEFINRNPRNLEQMLLEVKPHGFILDNPPVQYWNKLYFAKSSKHTSAKVVHYTGKTVITASTKEWAIRKQLYSAIDTNAVRAIAQVLASRCLRSGILYVHQHFTPAEHEIPKIKLFLNTLQEEGLQIQELNAIRMKNDEKFL